MITAQQILDATNGGLDIIRYYYPSADSKKNFKRREENTASASLKLFDTVWKVTDFGDDGRAHNAIDICMFEENLNFPQAIQTLASRYGVADESIREANRPEIFRRDPDQDELEGDFKFEAKEFSDFELKIWGPKVNSKILAEYKYKSIAWYSKTKRDKASGNLYTQVSKSTETYPIWMRDCGEFKKIYQPLNWDKAFRFFYDGKKPKNYINGFAELHKVATDYMSDDEDEGSDSEDDKGKRSKKYPAAVFCSGERDAMCCAAFGYKPLWLNSETAVLSPDDYTKISRLVDNIYNIPDIDDTGSRKAIEFGLQYLEIKTVWLPKWLSEYKDSRGKSRKDLRDYLELKPDQFLFNKLVENGMPMQFWSREYTKNGFREEINTEYALHFLRCHGFGTVEDPSSTTGLKYVRVVDNVVSEVKYSSIKTFLKAFLEDRHLPITIRNLVNNTNRFNSMTFDLLGLLRPDFSNFGRDFQFLNFRNGMVNVTEKDVSVVKRKYASRQVWEKNVIPIDFRRLDPSFSILQKEDGSFNIDIKHKESKFFCYLMNTSRIHWEVELEERFSELTTEEQATYAKEYRYAVDGPLLSDEEITEQKQHLINKIFALGYLLHSYKRADKTWTVLAMDYRMSENSEANGRSGKSFFFKSIEYMKIKNIIVENGRNKEMFENKHAFDRVNEYVDVVHIDDAFDYFKLDPIYNFITGDWVVNPKNAQSYSIPFAKSPKISIATNYVLRKIDSSTQARILYTLFSDYYHEDTARYKQARKISDDFDGKQLMQADYPLDDWNRDANFMMDCLQFYISTVEKSIKINPPMDRAKKRNLLANIGDQFYEWASVYFAGISDRFNCELCKDEVYLNYQNSIRTKTDSLTATSFKKALRDYCEYKGYILNPVALCNDGADKDKRKQNDRIINNVNGTSKEYIYIQNFDFVSVNINTDEPATGPLPF